MSPEAMRGARGLTAKSDQYSLGVILYECVAGRAPFDSESLLPLLEAVAAGRFKPPHEYRPELSRPLERAILRAMSLDPTDRFDHVRQLGQALWQASEGRTRLLWSPSFGTRQVTLGGHGTQPLSLPTPSTPALVTHVGPSYGPDDRVRSLRPPRRRMLAGLALGAFIVASLFVRFGVQPSVDRVAKSPVPAEQQRAVVASAAYQPALDEVSPREPDPSARVAVLAPAPSREAADPVPTATPASASPPLPAATASSEKGSRRDAPRERRSSSAPAPLPAVALPSSGNTQRPAARSTRPPPAPAPRARSEAVPVPAPARTSLAPYFGVNDAPILD
jgi:eukaryotic-like serine/threonine-protein kinase